jgi:hypothetical protein
MCMFLLFYVGQKDRLLPNFNRTFKISVGKSDRTDKFRKHCFLSEAWGNIAVYCDRKTSMVRGFGHGWTRNSMCYDFFWTITTY